MPRLTRKGQVTIPMEIREQLGLATGTLVEFEVEGDTVVMRKQLEGQDRGRRVVEMLRGRGDVRLTTDEIMDMTRGE
jgi:AbrB family looped-hinge helix DNA binding protein